jgi:predicted transcriptional regulator
VLSKFPFPGGRRDVESLRTVAELRNLLVHHSKKPYEYVAVPTEAIVSRLKEVCRRLLDPERVFPKFQKNVETVAPQDSLANVLDRIAKYDLSQFPVYSGGTFKGLLTENGITRWFAHHVSKESIVDAKDVLVRDVVPEEEKRSDFDFVARGDSVDSVRKLFSENKLLEVVLITETGARRERLLGIVTRWDRLEA